MSGLQHTYVNNGTAEYITVYVEGHEPLSADSTHPYFREIKDCVFHGDCGAAVIDLFDIAEAVSKRFEQLSERVSVANGRIYFDGDEQDDAVTRQILAFIDANKSEWEPLVMFMENIAANPTKHSREQLYDWLRANDLRITDTGLIIGFKGVGAAPQYLSGYSGKATVDGTVVEGRIPNVPGSVVEMPRTSVQHDPGASCSTGLHVGNRGYASAYAHPNLMEVHVNPRDVVSVPTDAGGDKVRVCRYTVVGPAGTVESYEYASTPEYDTGDYENY